MIPKMNILPRNNADKAGTGSRKFTVLLGFLLCMTNAVLAKECIQEGECKCTLDDGSGTIDLSPIARNDGSPLIDQQSSGSDSYFYSYNPCYPFSQGTCVNVAGCQHSPQFVVYYDIGDTNATLTYDNNSTNIIARYTSDTDPGKRRTSIVTFICDPSVDPPQYKVVGETELKVYRFEITSKYACLNGTLTTSLTTSSTPRPTLKRECYKVDECRCEFNDGTGVMDLNKVGRDDGKPLIDQEYTTNNYTYSFNPCFPFTEGTCTDVAGCQHDLGTPSLYYNIADENRVSFSYDGSSVVATYISDDGSRKSVVKYVCNPDMAITAYTVEGETQPSTYGFTILGKDVCPQVPGSSTATTPSTSITTLSASTTRIDIKKDCITIDQCKCQFNDGSGIVDLGTLGRQDGKPLIKDVAAIDNYLYSFNPCYPFTEGTCVNSAGCQYDATNVIYYNIGDAAKVKFSFDGINVIGTYVSDTGFRLSVVTYICDPNADVPSYSVNGEVNPAEYSFVIRSKNICPGIPETTEVSAEVNPTTRPELTREFSTEILPEETTGTNFKVTTRTKTKVKAEVTSESKSDLSTELTPEQISGVTPKIKPFQVKTTTEEFVTNSVETPNAWFEDEATPFPVSLEIVVPASFILFLLTLTSLWCWVYRRRTKRLQFAEEIGQKEMGPPPSYRLSEKHHETVGYGYKKF